MVDLDLVGLDGLLVEVVVDVTLDRLVDMVEEVVLQQVLLLIQEITIVVVEDQEELTLDLTVVEVLVDLVL